MPFPFQRGSEQKLRKMILRVNGIGGWGFPKIEIERKPQGNFQTDFIKFTLEHKGSSAGLASWLALFGHFYKLRTKRACAKRKMGLVGKAACEGFRGWNLTCQGGVTSSFFWVAWQLSRPVLWGQDGGVAHYRHCWKVA